MKKLDLNEDKRMWDMQSRLIGEAGMPAGAFATGRDPAVWFKIDRGAGLGGYYRLEKDKWFRSYDGPSKGYGIMFREIKITGKFKEANEWGEDYKKFKVTFKYLPTEFDDPDDDHSSNWESTKGWLFIKDALDIEPNDVKKFIEQNMSKYKPYGDTNGYSCRSKETKNRRYRGVENKTWGTFYGQCLTNGTTTVRPIWGVFHSHNCNGGFYRSG
jgi:hypothetical protein